MSNFKTELLFQLIKSLTKAEKRSFKLYAYRSGNRNESKFIQLFDALDGMTDYMEEVLLKKVPGIKKSQLSNIKAHLYKQILTSLRLTQSNKAELQIQEHIEYAHILYDKGLYKHSLQMLEKARNLAMEMESNILILEILDFEKLIESQYITRSINSRAEQLTRQTEYYYGVSNNTNDLSNLALRLYGLYINLGHVRNRKDLLIVRRFMRAHKPEVQLENLSFFEKLYFFQAQVWYYYIVQDFLMCYRYAQKWIDLFLERPNMIRKYPPLYIKGLHNLLAALFNLQHYRKFVEVLELLEEFEKKESSVNFNTEILTFLYIYTNRINKYYMEGRFSDGLKLIPEVEEKIRMYNTHLDQHRVLVFYYKIACLYFGSGNNLKAIEYLEKVIQFRDVSLRTDIQCFARILNLIAHYEEGLDEKLEYQVKSVYHFLGKMEDLQLIQKEIFIFLRKLGKITPFNLKREFSELRKKIYRLSHNKYERRPLLYLDILSWLDSKIEDRPVQDVMRGKFLEAKHGGLTQF